MQWRESFVSLYNIIKFYATGQRAFLLLPFASSDQGFLLIVNSERYEDGAPEHRGQTEGDGADCGEEGAVY